MTRILLGQSYYLRFDPKLWDAMQPYPPLGTLYAASYLRSRGYQVALFDAMLAESEEDWLVALKRTRPEIAILFEDNFNYLSKMCLLRMRQAAFTMLQMAKAQGCLTIVCGADATDHAEEYLRQGADFVLLGEGERTLEEVLQHLSDPDKIEIDKILGLAYRNPASPDDLLRNPRRQDIKDLDSLPFPAWDLVDVARYRRLWQEKHRYFSMNMVTTRGCPYHCNWCAKPIWGQRYNVRSPENVVAEMAWLEESYQPDHIWFADDIIGLKPGWLSEFADQLAARGLRIPFKCLSRVDLLLREGEVDALQRAGADIVWVGAESGAQKILTAMEKGTRVEQIYEARKRLKDAGVRAGFFLQFGYPGETREDIEATLQMVRDLMPDDIGMSVSYPLPGTPFYERVEHQLGTQRNWYDSSDMAMMYQGPYQTEFYRQLHTVLHKEYRLRKNAQSLNAVIGRSRPMQMADTRKAAALLYQSLTLPVARWQLNRLEQSARTPTLPLSPGMTLEEAGRPSPQTDS